MRPGVVPFTRVTRFARFAPIAAVLCGCAGAPWFLGETRDGVPVIPASSRVETVAKHRRKLIEAGQRGEKVVELAELAALEERGALHAPERKRFVELLRERAHDWAALGRPVPLAADLRHLIVLEPARARAVAPSLRSATRAAGDFWLAIGENARAEEEYRRAERMGADRMVYRFRAAWGASPGDLEPAVLEQALAELPERTLAPFATAYLDGGGAQPRALRRAWRAARVYGPPRLRARIESMPVAASFIAGVGGGGGVALPAPRASKPADAASSARGVDVPGAGDNLFGGPTLARRLVPLAPVFPELTAPGLRSRDWADRLMAEDPTAPDSLEVAALIDARAGRADGAARKLGDLVFYSADRAAGYARAARVWERAGEGRRGCLAWKRATHFGAADDPRWCDLLACARREPGATDPELVVRYIREQAPTLTCAADPATAPADGTPVDAGTADAGTAEDASARPPPSLQPGDAGVPEPG
ncbi:MAG: hypothetical protein ABUS79_09915 [Pseudomonadota bacterium]